MTWEFNRDYRDLGQVAQFWPAYLAVYEEMQAAGQYPYNDDFRGRIPGIEGPAEDTAIYLLQKLRAGHETQATVTERRAAGWRDLDPSEIDAGPVRYAGVAEYGRYNPDDHAASLTVRGSGWQEWESARVTRYHGSVMVLPGRNRTSGHLVSGQVLVKD